ncbi:MAG TPA: pectinesterase family protein, partial [Anaerohalosphaeraceae bacterium]|nr:pectinesterase family protein [Anaerohalosphaeraceae bacterium]
MKQQWMHRTGWLILSALLAVSWRGLGAERYWDIEYGTAGPVRLVLDAGVPDGPLLRPAVILIHGGGWSSGDKKDMAFLTEPLSEAGLVWFSINYRLAPDYRWPACLEDVKTAIRWVKSHAKEYKADASRIGLIGYSAGGHLACMAAVTADEQTRVQAVVGIAPPTDHEADSRRRGGLSPSLQKLLDRQQEITDETRLLLQRISPVQYVNAGLPPFLLIHGTEDTSVPYSQSIEFKAKLDHYNAPCRLIALQGAGHRLSDWPTQDYLAEMINWLKQALDSERRVPLQAPAPRTILAKTVAQDGSGDFTSVQAAVDAVPDGNEDSIVIAVKPGVYKERIVVPRHKRFICFKGTEASDTILTFDLYAGIQDAQGKEIGTFRTPSVTIEADDFTAENITFENSAGPVGQAVAIAVFGDRAVFRNCRFLGWQDTILDHLGRHYYENCYIAGHCDFIFGGGTAFFEKCRIECLKNGYI